MRTQIEIKLDDAYIGKRLDAAIAEALGGEFSRGRLQALIKQGALSQHGFVLEQASLKIKAPMSLTLDVPPPKQAEPEPQDIPINIIFEDDDLIVLNKQAGLVVHPGAGNWDGTLVNALLYHCKDRLSSIGGVERPGIVHRLDKETSGLMLVAKNDITHRSLTEQLADRSLSRTYAALVWGMPVPLSGKVTGNIGRHPSNRQKMTVTKNGGRDATTHYKIIDRFQGNAICLLDCTLETGRTHQIRVHMASKQHWIIGDPLYGRQATSGRAEMKKAGYEKDIRENVLSFPRQALHARKIGFDHPKTGERIEFEVELPNDMAGLLQQLKAAEA